MDLREVECPLQRPFYERGQSKGERSLGMGKEDEAGDSSERDTLLYFYPLTGRKISSWMVQHCF